MATATAAADAALQTEALVLAEEDLAQINNIAIVLGSIAPKYASTPMVNLIPLLNNFTLMNPNVTASDIAKFLGAPVQSIQEVIDVAFGDLDSMNFATDSVSQFMDIIPHPGGGNLALIIVATICIVITSVIMGLRLYSRHAITSKIKSFDWVMVAGWLLAEGWTFVAIWQAVASNTGAQWYDQSWNTYTLGQAVFTGLNATYPVILLMVKTSLLIFYDMLKPKCIRSEHITFRITLILTFILALGSAIACLFGTLLGCTPFDHWNYPLYQEGGCKIDRVKLWLVTGGLNIATDIIIWIIPMPIIWKLVLPVHERIGVIAMLGLGAFACVASGIRLHSVKRDESITNEMTYGFEKNICTIIEVHLAIICASVSALRALANKNARRPRPDKPSGTPGADKSKQSGKSGLSDMTATTVTVEIHMDPNTSYPPDTKPLPLTRYSEV